MQHVNKICNSIAVLRLSNICTYGGGSTQKLVFLSAVSPQMLAIGHGRLRKLELEIGQFVLFHGGGMIACQLIFGKDNVSYVGWFVSQCELSIYRVLHRKYRC